VFVHASSLGRAYITNNRETSPRTAGRRRINREPCDLAGLSRVGLLRPYKENIVRPKFGSILGSTLVLLLASGGLARAQISPPWGTSTAGGSGGTPTGPTNPGALGFGTSSAGGSGGVATGPLNPNAYGFGTSSAGGSGGVATGPTVPGLQPISPGLRIMSDPAGQGAAYAAPGVKRSAARRHRYVARRYR
jgi:hypothetical protein